MNFEALTNEPENLQAQLQTLTYTEFHSTYITKLWSANHQIPENHWIVRVEG